MIGIEDFENMTINQLGIIEGTKIPGRDEIILSQDMMNNTGYLVGDEIEVELPDGSTHFLTVVGEIGRHMVEGLIPACIAINNPAASK